MFRRPRNGTGMLAHARGRGSTWKTRRNYKSKRPIGVVQIAQAKIRRTEKSNCISRPATCWAACRDLGTDL